MKNKKEEMSGQKEWTRETNQVLEQNNTYIIVWK